MNIIFWETWFREDYIIWEWDSGLVIKIWNNRVMKIWKTKEDSDKLKQEAKDQEKFYIALNELRVEYWDEIVPDFIKIPFVMESPNSNTNWYYSFEMEYIDWVTLKNIDTKIYFKEYFSWTDVELDDIEQDEFLISRWLTIKDIKGISYDWAGTLEYYFPEIWLPFKRVLKLLKERWFKHLDLHTRNVILSWKEIYMIDFWMVKTPN